MVGKLQPQGFHVEPLSFLAPTAHLAEHLVDGFFLLLAQAAREFFLLGDVDDVLQALVDHLLDVGGGAVLEDADQLHLLLLGLLLEHEEGLFEFQMQFVYALVLVADDAVSARGFFHHELLQFSFFFLESGDGFEDEGVHGGLLLDLDLFLDFLLRPRGDTYLHHVQYHLLVLLAKCHGLASLFIAQGKEIVNTALHYLELF